MMVVVLLGDGLNGRWVGECEVLYAEKQSRQSGFFIYYLEDDGNEHDVGASFFPIANEYTKIDNGGDDQSLFC
jgi:hypothetical protein